MSMPMRGRGIHPGLVFGGQNIIAENGTCLVESRRFINESICADMDLERLDSERRRMSTFPDPAAAREEGGYLTVEFSFDAVSEDSAGSQIPRPWFHAAGR